MENNKNGIFLAAICGAITGSLIVKFLGFTALLIIIVVLIAIFGIACWLCR